MVMHAKSRVQKANVTPHIGEEITNIMRVLMYYCGEPAHHRHFNHTMVLALEF